MGGQYPSGWEYNFGGTDPNSTAYVLSHWPKSVAVTFSGGELGGNIFSGQNLKTDPSSDSPVIAAYQWYVGRGSITREAWDPITVLYGIVGLEGFTKLGTQPLFKYANSIGYNSIVASNGSNSWVNDTSVKNQHWLELADGVTNVTVARVINNFLLHPPGNSKCLT